jgi:hypothetical protein
MIAPPPTMIPRDTTAAMITVSLKVAMRDTYCILPLR